jgi:hypothetical protein
MINRSLPSDRRTPLVYVALGDSTVYGLGAWEAVRVRISADDQGPKTRIRFEGSQVGIRSGAQS